MSVLFDAIKIKNMELQNRFVRSATYDAAAERTGHVSEKQIKLFEELAKGGVGLIVTGVAYVHPSGQALPFMNAIANDDFIPGFKRLTAAVHEYGSKIAIQLFHGGREAARILNDRNEKALAPSVVTDDPYYKGDHRQITENEIWEVIDAFGDAAKRAREAEFDAVQIHGAHAFLFSQFLSPHTNRRDDDWGGALENRLQIHRKVYKAVREKVGNDYPVLIKIGVEDGFPGGLEFNEGRLAAQQLAECGYDALEISQGLRGESFGGTEFRTNIDHLDQEGYFREWCREIKSNVSAPAMMVGGLRTFELMEGVVQKGETDFVSLSRPFIREPGLISAWKGGSRHRATCISCNMCLLAIRKGESLRCVKDEEASTEA